MHYLGAIIGAVLQCVRDFDIAIAFLFEKSHLIPFKPVPLSLALEFIGNNQKLGIKIVFGSESIRL